MCALPLPPLIQQRWDFFCLFSPEQFSRLLSVCVYHFHLLVDPAKLFTVHTIQQLLIDICFLMLNSWQSWRWKDESNKIMTIWEVIKQETPLYCDWKEMSGCQPSELFHMNQAIMGLFFMCLKGGLGFIFKSLVFWQFRANKFTPLHSQPSSKSWHKCGANWWKRGKDFSWSLILLLSNCSLCLSTALSFL